MLDWSASGCDTSAAPALVRARRPSETIAGFASLVLFLLTSPAQVGFGLILEGKSTLGQYTAFRSHLNSYSNGWSTLHALYRELSGVGAHARYMADGILRSPAL